MPQRSVRARIAPGTLREAAGGVGAPEDLAHGERQVVGDMAAQIPDGQVPGGAGPMGGGPPPPAPGLGVDVWAPTGDPGQPITEGLVPPGAEENQAVEFIRAMYRNNPYPDLRRLIERMDLA